MSENLDSSFFTIETAGDAGDITVVRFTQQQLTDELNIVEMGNDLFALVEQQGRLRVVLNMEVVDYVTSSVLGKLITLHRKLHRISGRLILCRLTAGLGEILSTSHLLQYFEVADDAAEAVTRFGPAA